MSEVVFPNEWLQTTIENILQPQDDGKLIHQGWSPQCLKESAGVDDWGVLKTTAIQDGFYLEHENKKLPSSKEPKPRIEVANNDLLMTNAGPRARCGVVTLVRKTRSRLMLSGKMYRMRFNEHCIEPQLVEAWLRTSQSQDAIDSIKTGISESGLNMTQGRFKELSVPVIPFAEQQEIAMRLDDLLAQVDPLKTRLDGIPSILERFRQSTLAAATSGKLTKDWRGDDSGFYDQVNSEVKSDKKLSKLKDLASDEVELSISLHGEVEWKRWKLYPLEKLVDSAIGIPYGIVQTGQHTEGGVPTVRCGDVKPLEIDESGLKLVDKEISDQYKRTLLGGGEVLLAIRGTVGNAAVAPISLAGCNISREVALIPVRKNINPHFIALLLQSPGGYKCLAEKVRGVAQQGINLADIKRFVVPLPTLEEQTEIVRRVEELFAFADQVEQRVKDAQAHVNHLTQSILAKAFRGELTKEWRASNPDLITGENSAEALLQRIKSERETLDPKKKTRKKR